MVFKSKAKEDKVLVVGDAFKRAPNADYIYASDHKWWLYAHKLVTQTNIKQYFSSLVSNSHKDFEGVIGLPGDVEPGLGKRGISYDENGEINSQIGFLHYGGNSGYQSLNLAYFLCDDPENTLIVMLGYDMKRQANGNTHTFSRGDIEGRPKRLNVTSPYGEWVKKFDALAVDLDAAGVEVINCTRDTAITSFKQLPLEEVLNVNKL